MSLTLADIPQELKDQIIAEHYRLRMTALARMRTPAKQAASRANLAAVNAARGISSAKRMEAALNDMRVFDCPPSKAARLNGVQYDRFITWLKARIAKKK